MARITVAVDGPAGAGKGTLCQAVARRFGMAYLDTGALYRAVGLHALTHDGADGPMLAAWAGTMPFAFRPDAEGRFRAWLAATEVTRRLRDEEVGEAASRVSSIPEVRQALLSFQRHYGAPAPAILDGRDVGTVVLPEATLKLFVTANLDERARRRAFELQERGEVANFQEIRSRMAERDRRDAERALAPLRPADDAVLIDTSAMNIAESIQQVVQLVDPLFNPGAP